MTSMKSMNALACAAVMCLVAMPASAEVQVAMKNGKVSIVAKDATLRQILTEWARVGQTRIVNIERVRELSGSKSPIKYIPYDQAYESGFEDMPRRVPALAKVESLIGYKAKNDLDDILVQVIDYFRKK